MRAASAVSFADRLSAPADSAKARSSTLVNYLYADGDIAWFL